MPELIPRGFVMHSCFYKSDADHDMYIWEEEDYLEIVVAPTVF